MTQRERERKAHELFQRFDGNPVLRPEDWPYPANAVFNPGAAEVAGRTLLLARVEDLRGFSHLTVAQSPNGFTDWEINPEPTLTADSTAQEEPWGLEDPRIVWLEEQNEFAITYVSFSEGGPLVSLATTKDFHAFTRLGALLPPEDKDACLFPRRFEGRFALIHRPIVRGEAHIWLSFSPDLKHWGDHHLLVHTRHAYWDSRRVGLACQPIETPEGWLVFYHGVRTTTSSHIYRLGLVLLDLDHPWKMRRRSAEWVLGPHAQYERVGDVSDVVFPTGAVVIKQTGELRMYYGAADSTIAVATTRLDDVLEYILSSPEWHS